MKLNSLTNVELSALARDLAASEAPRAAPPEPGDLCDLMDRLRSQRLYEEMLALARAPSLQTAFDSSPRLTRLKGQALIDNGLLEEAEQALEPIAKRKGDDAEALEARGLLGRIAKQRYLNDCKAGRPSADQLRLAIDRYLGAYLKSKLKQKPAWHGVNAIAMLRRAQSDGVRHKSSSQVGRIAANLLKDIEQRRAAGTSGFWDLATAGEAYLAAGNPDLAELWFRRYAEVPELEPFALASTIRQLKEVWGLDPTQGTGRLILPPLEQTLARGAHTAIVSGDFVKSADRESLEKVFGDAAFISYEKMLLGLERCKAIGRVETTANEGFGTGFAIPGSSLSSKLDGALVFMTNAHVLSDTEPDALRPANAQVTFHALPGAKGKPFNTKFGKILKSSDPNTLDFTVLTLERQPAKLQPFPIAPTLPTLSGKAQVFVIGHPRGGGMTFSLQDNQLVDHGAPGDARVHYRAPTEPGSSGSPVFNTSWELIALHHAGSASMQRIHGVGVYEANEGLWIQAIRASCNGR